MHRNSSSYSNDYQQTPDNKLSARYLLAVFPTPPASGTVKKLEHEKKNACCM